MLRLEIKLQKRPLAIYIKHTRSEKETNERISIIDFEAVTDCLYLVCLANIPTCAQLA